MDWDLSHACYDQECGDCEEDWCAHHCHDSVWFDAAHITWRRMETVAVTAMAEDGGPVV